MRIHLTQCPVNSQYCFSSDPSLPLHDNGVARHGSRYLPPGLGRDEACEGLEAASAWLLSVAFAPGGVSHAPYRAYQSVYVRYTNTWLQAALGDESGGAVRTPLPPLVGA